MSVLQPSSYGLVHQVGPGTGGRGFGSYKADNTELIRPYQQESSSPIGRGYPMGIVSGAPTVYDPRAGIQEDPVVVLLKKLLGMKSPVVTKAPDAGFRSNEQVYPTSGQALELPGRTLGAAPADRGLGGGGGGSVVESASTDYGSSLNKYKSELAGLSSATPSTTASFKSAEGSSSLNVDTDISYSSLSEVYEQRWDDWIDVIGSALDEGSFYGLEKSAIVGSERYDPRLEALEQLDDILLELRILNLDSDRGMSRRYRNSDVYYAGLAELTGEISFDDTFAYLVQASDEERIAARKEILDKLKERGIVVLSKSTIEANVLSRTKNQGTPSMMNSSGSSLSGVDIARRPSSQMSMGSSARPEGYWDRRGSLGSRRSSLLSSRKSSSSGNSSGVSFDPKKPDTSKAFDRPSRRKKKQ